MFVEPEGITTQEMYLQGLTTSLPVFVQEKIIKATPGLGTRGWSVPATRWSTTIFRRNN